VLIKQFISRANPGGAEPVPDSGLIYFVHGNETKYLPPIDGTSSGAGNVGFNENATLPFQPGKTYRLRVVNTSTFAMFHFWIDGHDMEIIEVDGVGARICADYYISRPCIRRSTPRPSQWTTSWSPSPSGTRS
jgi:iron transport multicopper oxidase